MIAENFAVWLDAHEKKDLLRFLTCGSVDDGKSTLIGRMLFESGSVPDDQLAALQRDSARSMPQGGLDYSLLVDGLEAERAQGITIDVAFRYFGTSKRSFIVADTPGHEQYTRNMVTGASTAELAVLLVDARKGLLTQTRRHAWLCALMGIKDVVLAVNKMDLVGYDETRFTAIIDDFRILAETTGMTRVTAIPVSAIGGDNLITLSTAMPWYRGPTLLPFLETVAVSCPEAERPFRLPVQWVCRPNQDFRGYAGTIASGSIRVGDRVVVEPSGRSSTVTAIVTYDGELADASAGQAVTVTLADEIDVSGGDVIAAADDRPEVSDQFQAHVVWMAEPKLIPGRPYLFRLGGRLVGCQVTEIHHKINVNSGERIAAKSLGLNDVAVCNISLDAPVPFEPYRLSAALGGFIIIDRVSSATLGCGMIEFALRRSANIHWQSVSVDKGMRSHLKGQKGCVLWFTGLSASGKSTIANLVEKRLAAGGRHTYLLDGDNIRHGLNRDLGFTEEDRVENIRRVGEVARLFVDAGLVTLTAFISPFRAERQMARRLVEDAEFIEIFVDAPLELCERRDPKGLYRKARQGNLPNFTGIGSPYEPPQAPELHLDATLAPDLLAEQVIEYLSRRGII